MVPLALPGFPGVAEVQSVQIVFAWAGEAAASAKAPKTATKAEFLSRCCSFTVLPSLRREVDEFAACTVLCNPAAIPILLNCPIFAMFEVGLVCH
jgi:hypothetical protein